MTSNNSALQPQAASVPRQPEADSNSHRDDFMDGCVTSFIREAAYRVSGGNCAFVDNDVRLLEVLAVRAVLAGLTHDLSPEMAAKVRAACAVHPVAKASEQARLIPTEKTDKTGLVLEQKS